MKTQISSSIESQRQQYLESPPTFSKEKRASECKTQRNYATVKTMKFNDICLAQDKIGDRYFAKVSNRLPRKQNSIRYETPIKYPEQEK